MVAQTWDGLHLDKDILFPGNKIYSSATCVFVDRRTNNILSDSGAARGLYPIGVYIHSGSKKNPFRAEVNINNKKTYLGCYPTAELAHDAWVIAKKIELRKCAATQSDKRVETALLLFQSKLK